MWLRSGAEAAGFKDDTKVQEAQKKVISDLKRKAAAAADEGNSGPKAEDKKSTSKPGKSKKAKKSKW